MQCHAHHRCLRRCTCLYHHFTDPLFEHVGEVVGNRDGEVSKLHVMELERVGQLETSHARHHQHRIGLWGTHEQKRNREGRNVGPETFVDW